jgi:hypothetical protein
MASFNECTQMKRQFSDNDEENMKIKSKRIHARQDLVTEIKQRTTYSYRIYWLDESSKHDPIVEYEINQSNLRGIIDYLEMHTTVNKSMEEIVQRTTKDEEIIVIITLSNNLDLINTVHELSHIHSIYIYAPSTIDKNILSTYTKVSRLHFLQ